MQNILQAVGLTKYYGSKRGVEGLDFSIREGEIFGVLGPNGSGKTTTIRLILDFIRPTRGKVLVFGVTPWRGGRAQRKRIGYLAGEPGVYEDMRGEKFLNLCRDLSGNGAPLRDWLCDMLTFGARERGSRIKGYSKGMKQKLGIVQALQHDPDLVILDEPTSGLDPLVQANFYEVLRELKRRGKTVFFSSHVVSEVQQLCDRAGVLMDGKLILDTAVGELVAAAERVLWVRFAPASREDLAPPSHIGPAAYARREGAWVVYHFAPESSPGVLTELALLAPVDFRAESGFEQSFLKLYSETSKPKGGGA